MAVAVQQAHVAVKGEARMLRRPTIRGTRAARAVRGLWPDRNPLRRTLDQVEAMVAGGLVVAFLAGAPLAAVAAGHAVYGVGSRVAHAQQATWQQDADWQVTEPHWAKGR